ncbi:MAG: family 1 glycosylhydrolase [Burkholderiaceae bacterium]|nr:family 1 glycosylhydrolase [Microbacteriaceae bacterium]
MARTPRDDSWLHEPKALAAIAPGGVSVGVSTCAFSVEGAVREDGREPSTWDTFMGQADRIVDGSDAAVAADHYHRVSEDVRLVRELGADAYRFSLAWSRLQPGGTGRANRTAVAFYDRLIDELLAAGIRPVVALHHFDLPEPLQHSGGWLARDTAYRLADYAFLAGEAFGDRVGAWTTITDPATVTSAGYALGTDAPGARLGLGALPAAHHQLLGHGLAVEALRAAGVVGGVGITNTHTPAEPASDRADDELHTALFDVLQNRIYADPLLLGGYPTLPEELAHLTTAFDEIEPADLATIAAPLDFYGVTYTSPARVRASTLPLRYSLEPWPDVAATDAGVPQAPEYLGVALRELGQRYGDALPPVTLFGLGAAFTDVVQRDGSIDDASRAVYLGEHLAVAFSGAPGVRVSGCFVDALLDGWEWTAGFSTPRGLVHVNPQTQDRTPKRSYRWLQEVLANR